MPLSSSALHSESLEGLLPRCRLKFCGTRVRFKCQVPEARIRRRIFIQHETDMCVHALLDVRRRIFFSYVSIDENRNRTCSNCDDTLWYDLNITFRRYIFQFQKNLFCISESTFLRWLYRFTSYIIYRLSESSQYIYNAYKLHIFRFPCLILTIRSVTLSYRLSLLF